MGVLGLFPSLRWKNVTPSMGGVIIPWSLQKCSHLCSTPARAGDGAEISDSRGQGWVCGRAQAPRIQHQPCPQPLALVSLSLHSPWYTHVASISLWLDMYHGATNS